MHRHLRHLLSQSISSEPRTLKAGVVAAALLAAAGVLHAPSEAKAEGLIAQAMDGRGDGVTLYDGKGFALTVGGQVVPVVVIVDDTDEQDGTFIADEAAEGTRFWLGADLKDDESGLTYMGRISVDLETANPADQIWGRAGRLQGAWVALRPQP